MKDAKEISFNFFLLEESCDGKRKGKLYDDLLCGT